MLLDLDVDDVDDDVEDVTSVELKSGISEADSHETVPTYRQI